MRRLVCTVLVFALAAVQCGKGGPTAPSPRRDTDPPPGTRTAVLLGAGDIGICGSQAALQTGLLIERTLGDVFLAGDIAYPHGSAANFQDCFTPVWGHAAGRWHAVPGNHEYESAGAGPYFDYFGPAAGPGRRGYYEFTLGEWLILMIDSNQNARVNSPQYEFVRQTLQSRRNRCQMAIWHHPLFTSGQNGPNPQMRDLFAVMHENGVDVVVNGHDHVYERFSRQDADGRQNENGIRQFIVGTGGAGLYEFVTVAPNSAMRIAAHGIIRFTLRPDAYDWEFLEVAGTLTDNGTTPCH